MLRTFAHGAMDPLSIMVDPLSYFRSSQCSATGAICVVVCAILSRMVHIVHIK